MNEVNEVYCTNDTIANGICYGYAVCGYCYGAIVEGVHSSNTIYDQFNLIVIGMLLPAIGLMGLVGDTISAFIYSRKTMISSLNIYLCALACSDIIIILTAYFLFFLENMRKRSISANSIFAQLAPVMFPIGLTAQSLSVFLTVTAAFDCFILVAGSTRMKKNFCTVNSSLRMLAVIVFMAVAYNSPHVFEIYVIDCWSLPFNQPSKDVCPSALRSNELYVTIYYAWLYTIIMAAGPFFLLILINSAIVITLRRKQRIEGDEGGDGDVVTLILVVALFVTCNVLPLTVNLLEMLFSIENSYLIDLSNLMVVVNSSCNFLIYYVFGANFRRTLKQYMRNYSTVVRSATIRRIGRRANSFQSIPVHHIAQPQKEYLI